MCPPDSLLNHAHEAAASELVDAWRACGGQQAVDGPALLASAAQAGLVPCPYTGACFTRRAQQQRVLNAKRQTIASH